MERSVKKRFSIGDQYDIYENYLSECLIIEVNRLEYLIYKYEGTEMEIYGLEVKTTRLAFNGDVLQSIIYELKKQNFDHCRTQINRHLNTKNGLRQNPFECFRQASNSSEPFISLSNVDGINYLCVGKQILTQILRPCKHG